MSSVTHAFAYTAGRSYLDFSGRKYIPRYFHISKHWSFYQSRTFNAFLWLIVMSIWPVGELVLFLNPIWKAIAWCYSWNIRIFESIKAILYGYA